MKRLLALDGGGIKGIVSLQILARIESQIREATGEKDAVLADHFDYIGGTSTGSLSAACLSLGMEVAEIMSFYNDFSKTIFSKRKMWSRLKSIFDDAGLKLELQKICSEDDGSPMTMGSKKLKTFLLVVTRNASTGSPWPLTNNPDAKYNLRTQVGCNLDFALWQVLRASCAAPVFFSPELVEFEAEAVSDQEKVESVEKVGHYFEDGGITPFNNPAYLLFLKATLPEYKMNWPVGLQNMSLTSIGTGIMPTGMTSDKAPNVLSQTKSVPASLIRSFQDHQDLLCRINGQCFFGPKIDSELGDLKRENPGAKFRYTRYEPKFGNREISEAKRISKQGIGLANIKIMDYLSDLGAAYAKKNVRFEDWHG